MGRSKPQQLNVSQLSLTYPGRLHTVALGRLHLVVKARSRSNQLGFSH
jgi:hypothetical protein